MNEEQSIHTLVIPKVMCLVTTGLGSMLDLADMFTV